jgi:hypothetical protein
MFDIPKLHAAVAPPERKLCNPKFLIFTPSVAKVDLTISLALVYDSFSFLFSKNKHVGFLPHAISVYQMDVLKSMAAGNQKTQKMDMYVKI